MILKAVFFLSFSALAFEVLLTRLFAISQWSHLAFMVIGIAMFGFGAGGAFLGLLEIRWPGWEKSLSRDRPASALILLYTMVVIAVFMALNALDLDYFRLPVEPGQIVNLFIACVLVALPFLLAGLAVSLAYSAFPEKSGVVYFSSMTGSAAGAFLPAMLLPALPEGMLVILTAMIPLASLLFPTAGSVGKRIPLSKQRCRFAVTLLAGMGVICLSSFPILHKNGALIRIEPSPYKELSQIRQFPKTNITAAGTGIRGRIEIAESPYIRYAPGLSLKYTRGLPAQKALFKDGDDKLVLYDAHTAGEAAFSRFTLPYIGYRLAENPDRVLLVLRGGGSAIPCAIASGAREIAILEENPHRADIIQAHYRLPVINKSPRAFLARSRDRYDVIQVENWGPSIPGAAALAQNYDFTVEAFTEYLDHLTETGVLIITRRLLLPPANTIRLWAAAMESLKIRFPGRPERHLAMIRNWDVFTLLVSPRPLAGAAGVREFAREMNFDLVYLDGLSKEEANQYNIFDRPHHFMDIDRLARSFQSGAQEAFFEKHPLDVAPQRDSRPFPNRFLKWTGLTTMYKSKGERLYSLLLSGEIVVAVLFAEALCVALVLLGLPLLIIRKKERRPSPPQFLFFAGVGAGFMFVEIYFIDALTLLFGDPLISVTAVLVGILVFSGAGGRWSRNLAFRNVKKALAALLVVLALIFLTLDSLLPHILALPIVPRWMVAFLLLAPPGFLLGLPFPVGMRCLPTDPAQRAYAWTINGCASVLASIASAQIAISPGIPALLAFAICSYAFALAAVREK